MNDFMNNYFGPLGKEYCIYFYAMSIFFFILLLLAIIGVVVAMISTPKQVNFMFFVNAIMLLFNTILAYLINRLLHTMCVNSIR
jgi:hypothetical protein